MPKLITATDMVRSFSDIVGRVYYKGESFNITKGDNIVARLSPTKSRSTIKIANLNNLFKFMPKLEYSDTEDFTNILNEVRLLKGDSGSSKWE